jgi:chorismate mutase/prephenate dehydrogenase
MSTPPPLDTLRARIAAVDREILALAAERLSLAALVGDAKRIAGLAVRNHATEADVMRRFRELADEMHLDPEFASSLARTLIAESVRHQEERRALAVRTDASTDSAMDATSAESSTLRILVVGGGGKMGRWLARFFAAQGHVVSTFDPSGPVDHFVHASDLSTARDADVVLLAMPLSSGPEALRNILALEPRGLVADISSLKSHLVADLRNGAERGLRVASLHPLFGPSARTLAGRIMTVCDCGNASAADDAAALFRDTALTITRMPVERHDEYMQYVLGLSHLVSVLFFTTLQRSGFAFDDLAQMASTTFYKQARTAAEVARENPRLYHEIQQLNRHSPELYRLVDQSLRDIESAALAAGSAEFEDLMERGRAWFPSSLPVDLG